MKQILVSSRNPHKIREIRSILPEYEILTPADIFPDMPSVEETGTTYQSNAVLKAMALFDAVALKPPYNRIPILADDSGIELTDLDGAPGVLSMRFWTPDHSEGTADYNNAAMLKALRASGRPQPWLATYHAVVAVVLYGRGIYEIQMFHQVCHGQIVTEPRGMNGFNYDSYFEMAFSDKTMAELTDAEKNAISHRGLAIRESVKSIEAYYRRF